MQDEFCLFKLFRIFQSVSGTVDIKIKPVHGLPQAAGIFLQTFRNGFRGLFEKAFGRMPFGMHLF